MISSQYLAALGMGVALWCGLFFGFIALADPYGVSPLRIHRHRLNEFKPARVDIDRLLKPYEVWRYQPRTVFLGTSRVHQGLDPAVLDGTPLVPAYNASIPASTLSENAAHLEQFFELDPNLKIIFVELFFSNFIVSNKEAPRLNQLDFARNAVALHASATALFDVVRTVQTNIWARYEGAQVTARGNWLSPEKPYSLGSFTDYVDAIMSAHKRLVDLKLEPSAFVSLDRIVAACRAHGATLHLVIAPHHPYDDYRWLSLGYWSLLEEWYRKVAGYPVVISFAQFNTPLEEPITERMKYWYDPIHFSKKTGGLMLQSSLGRWDSDIPDNMLKKLNAANVEFAIADRKAGLEGWMRRNPAFVDRFESAKMATGNDEATRRWAKENPELAQKREAEASEARALARSKVDHVAESLARLADLQMTLTRRYPADSIKEYRNVTTELAAAEALPLNMMQGGKVQNAWGGAFQVQLFPAGAWKAEITATYNYVFEGVPAKDCRRFITDLGRVSTPKPFRINLEPSDNVHAIFPLPGADGCDEGVNVIGYTVIAR